MLSAIQTKRHFVRSLHFDSFDSNDGEEFDTPQLDIALAHWKCGDHWHVRLKVETTQKGEVNPRYLIKAEVEGLFEVDKNFPVDKTEDIVRMNGGAILYGTIRELMFTNSSRSMNGPAELPTIDARVFIEASEQSEDTTKTKKTVVALKKKSAKQKS